MNYSSPNVFYYYYFNDLYLLVFQVWINIRCSSPELLVVSGEKKRVYEIYIPVAGVLWGCHSYQLAPIPSVWA